MPWQDQAIDVDPRIRLRPWRMDDLDALVRHADDPRIAPGLSDRFPQPYTRADGEAFLSGAVIDLDDPVFAIEIKGEACGGIGARPFAGERSVGAEFGYWLGSMYWGRGVMTRVVAVFAPWVMEALALQRLQATVVEFNLASARVLGKNGFVEEGVLRQAVRKHGRIHDLRMFSRVRGQPV
ncbi:GNAT family N-acetyltransferase [Luteimonas sp. SDU101]|uniref:GNAT family N-acetyltransferase n=1 Tax=Luteimonas sp. SDU101 TaxID=3422593 RepID=UPI003EBB66D2